MELFHIAPWLSDPPAIIQIPTSITRRALSNPWGRPQSGDQPLVLSLTYLWWPLPSSSIFCSALILLCLTGSRCDSLWLETLLVMKLLVLIVLGFGNYWLNLTFQFKIDFQLGIHYEFFSQLILKTDNYLLVMVCPAKITNNFMVEIVKRTL